VSEGRAVQADDSAGGGAVSPAVVSLAVDIDTARQFAEHVAAGEFEAAHALFTIDARKVHWPEVMRLAVARMTAYAPGPIRRIRVLDEFVLREWPAKQRSDLACVYVALEGDRFNEAVSVVLSKTADGVRIREVVWGRP